MQHHSYFADLSTADIEGTDVIWEAEATLGDQSFDITLWADADQQLDGAQLDAFAALVQDLPALEAKARAILQAELEGDDAFMAHHLAEVDNFPALAAIAPNGEISVADFVRAMRLTHIGLWANEPASVILDFQIDPEHSDQILAVKLDGPGELVSVDWES